MAGEIRARLAVDMSEMRLQIEELKAGQAAAENRNAQLARDLDATRTRAQEVERTAAKLESQIKSYAKGLIKAGAASIGADLLQTLVPEGDLAGSLANISSQALTGAAFMGLPGLIGGAAAGTIGELVKTLRAQESKIRELEEMFKRSLESQRQELLRAVERLEQADETNRQAIYEEDRAMRERTSEMIWQAAQAMP